MGTFELRTAYHGSPWAQPESKILAFEPTASYAGEARHLHDAIVGEDDHAASIGQAAALT